MDAPKDQPRYKACLYHTLLAILSGRILEGGSSKHLAQSWAHTQTSSDYQAQLAAGGLKERAVRALTVAAGMVKQSLLPSVPKMSSKGPEQRNGAWMQCKHPGCFPSPAPGRCNTAPPANIAVNVQNRHMAHSSLSSDLAPGSIQTAGQVSYMERGQGKDSRVTTPSLMDLSLGLAPRAKGHADTTWRRQIAQIAEGVKCNKMLGGFLEKSIRNIYHDFIDNLANSSLLVWLDPAGICTLDSVCLPLLLLCPPRYLVCTSLLMVFTQRPLGVTLLLQRQGHQGRSRTPDTSFHLPVFHSQHIGLAVTDDP